MSELSGYVDRKQSLLKSYDIVLGFQDDFWAEHRRRSNGQQPTLTVEAVQQKRTGLEKEHFLVSVSGQIKAGKSTLINALVFEKDLLPADDLPHTVKITILEYGEQPGFEAEFYNTKEWQILKEQTLDGETGGYFRQFLRKAVNRVQEEYGVLFEGDDYPWWSQ